MDNNFSQLIIEQIRQTSGLEWLGTVTGFICIYLAAREHILNWPIAIISSFSYAVLFFDSRLYGDSALQLYFIATSFYGWYFWVKNKQQADRPVISLKMRGQVLVILIVLALSVLSGLILDRYTNSNVPYIDGFCTAASLVAQVLLTRKIIQNWILWIITDICYVPLYLYKDLYLTAVLYTLFLALAVMGYISWKRTQKLSQ